MEVKLISQPGHDASVEKWELGSIHEVGWGRMGDFGLRIASGVCVLLLGSEGAGMAFVFWSELGLSISHR